MLLGPIFRVELVATARRRRYFLLRVLYAILILFVLWTAYESSSWARSGQGNVSIQHGATLAASFFYSFSWLQMLALLVVGPAMAVGTIASERERRTIEYLFATDLSNTEIVLGKTIARLMLIGQFVLVGLPILFMFRLMGGIPANLLLTTFLLAASTAMLLTALSICVSVWSARARDATVRIYVSLAALLFLPMIFKPLLGLGTNSGTLLQVLCTPIVDACLVINPLWTLANSMGNRWSMGFDLDMSVVLRSVGWQLLVSVAALVWATFAVRRVHLGDSSRGNVKEKRRLNFRFPRWRPALGARPMLWKEMFADTAKTRLGFIGNVAVGLILLTVIGSTLYAFIEAIAHSFGNDGPNFFFVYLSQMSGFLGSGMLLLLAGRSASMVTSEKERDCWMSLLATPLSGAEIMTGKMWGNLYSVRWSFLVLAAAWGLGILLEPVFILPTLATTLTFFLAAWYVTNLGLFFSLRSKTSLRAMGATLGTLVFTSGGYLFCCCMVSVEEEVMLAPCIPFLLGFPSMAYYSYDLEHFWNRSGFISGYFLGIIGYLTVAFVFQVIVVRNFNRISGRCGR